MKKIFAALLLLMVFASPALAASKHRRNHNPHHNYHHSSNHSSHHHSHHA